VSFRDTRAAIFGSILKPLERLVALALVESLPNAAPSVQLLCARTGMHRTAVMRAIQGLELSGMLTVVREDGRRSVYHFNLSSGATGRCEQPVAVSDITSRSERHPPVAQSDPKQTIKADKKLERPRKRATQLPEDWEPPEVKPELTAGRDVALELERFRDHWKATAQPKADWDATWRNWLRNASKFAPRSVQAAPGSRFAAPEHPCAGWAPNAAWRGVKAFQTGLLKFETEENAFRRSDAFAACRSPNDADQAFRIWVRARAIEARAAKGAA
jgi:hypothetical protein